MQKLHDQHFNSLKILSISLIDEIGEVNVTEVHLSLPQGNDQARAMMRSPR